MTLIRRDASRTVIIASDKLQNVPFLYIRSPHGRSCVITGCLTVPWWHRSPRSPSLWSPARSDLRWDWRAPVKCATSATLCAPRPHVQAAVLRGVFGVHHSEIGARKWRSEPCSRKARPA